MTGMNVLVIYDSTGHILSQASGNGVYEPKGVPYMITMVPDGKRLVSIDVSGEQPQPVFEDIPPTPQDETEAKLTELTTQVANSNETAIMALEAVAAIYEAVTPFLP